MKRLFVERNIVFMFDKSGEGTHEHEKKVDIVNAIIDFDKLSGCDFVFFRKKYKRTLSYSL